MAVARAGHDDGVGARAGDDAAGQRQHFGEAHAGEVERIAARLADLAQHVDLVGAHLRHHDDDLRILDEVAALELGGDVLLGGRDGQAGELHAAQQRVADGAAFVDARLEAQVGALVDGDADRVAGADARLVGVERA